MRVKTSLTIDEHALELARDRAEADGTDMGRWLDRAIRHEAALADAAILEDWEAGFSPEQKAIGEALSAADRAEQAAGRAGQQAAA